LREGLRLVRWKKQEVWIPAREGEEEVGGTQSTANIDAHHLVDVLNKHKETTKELEAKLKELEED